MTQGIFIHGRRPKSKKEIKEFIDGLYEVPVKEDGSGQISDPYGLVIEATGIFGNEFDGSLAKAVRSIQAKNMEWDEGQRFPQNKGITFVGPNPHTNRKFYGTIKWNTKKERFVVT